MRSLDPDLESRVRKYHSQLEHQHTAKACTAPHVHEPWAALTKSLLLQLTRLAPFRLIEITVKIARANHKRGVIEGIM